MRANIAARNRKDAHRAIIHGQNFVTALEQWDAIFEKAFRGFIECEEGIAPRLPPDAFHELHRALSQAENPQDPGAAYNSVVNIIQDKFRQHADRLLASPDAPERHPEIPYNVLMTEGLCNALKSGEFLQTLALLGPPPR